jgi:hypothetical protein
LAEIEKENHALKQVNHKLVSKLQETMAFLVDYANMELDERDYEEDNIIEELQAKNSKL